jgi:hypothetical protein
LELKVEKNRVTSEKHKVMLIEVKARNALSLESQRGEQVVKYEEEMLKYN